MLIWWSLQGIFLVKNYNWLDNFVWNAILQKKQKLGNAEAHFSNCQIAWSELLLQFGGEVYMYRLLGLCGWTVHLVSERMCGAIYWKVVWLYYCHQSLHSAAQRDLNGSSLPQGHVDANSDFLMHWANIAMNTWCFFNSAKFCVLQSDKCASCAFGKFLKGAI